MIREWRCGEQRSDDLSRRVRHDCDVGISNRLFRTIGEDALEVGKPGLYVLAVGPDERCGVQHWVVDTNLVTLAKEGLRKIDVRAFTEIVAVGLETEPQKRNAVSVPGHDSVDRFVD